MVNNKYWWKCEKCDKKMRSPYNYDNIRLCYHCYNKIVTPMPPIDVNFSGKHTQIVLSVQLTIKEHEKMMEKINKLYDNPNRKMSAYIRELVLKDLKDDN